MRTVAPQDAPRVALQDARPAEKLPAGSQELWPPAWRAALPGEAEPQVRPEDVPVQAQA